MVNRLNSPSNVCMLIHGFSGGPYEVEPLARHLQEKGWDPIVPTLPGHHNELLELGSVGHQDWLSALEVEAQKAEKKAQGEFDLIGFSMGGLLSAYLANRFRIRRLVLLNAAVYYVSPVRFIKHTWRRINERNYEDFRRIKKIPWSATLEFLKLVKLLKPEFSRIQAPTLIIQGRQDPIIHPYSGGYIAAQVKAEKELVFFPKSKHMICWEEECELLFWKVHQFLNQTRKPEHKLGSNCSPSEEGDLILE